MERLNILDVIKKSRKYDIALLTSFNFEISFFERSVLNKFYDNGIRRVSLFIDSKEFTKSLSDVKQILTKADLDEDGELVVKAGKKKICRVVLK